MRFKQRHWERMQNKKNPWYLDNLTGHKHTNIYNFTLPLIFGLLPFQRSWYSSKKFTGVLLCAWVQLICKRMRRAPLHIYPEITHVLKLKKITSDSYLQACSIQVFKYFILTFLSSPTRYKFLNKQINTECIVYYAEYLRFYPQFMQIKMRICTYFSLSQQVSVTATADLLTLIFEVKVQCRSKIA